MGIIFIFYFCAHILVVFAENLKMAHLLDKIQNHDNNGYPFLPKLPLKVGTGFTAHCTPVQTKYEYPSAHLGPAMPRYATPCKALEQVIGDSLISFMHYLFNYSD